MLDRSSSSVKSPLEATVVLLISKSIHVEMNIDHKPHKDARTHDQGGSYVASVFQGRVEAGGGGRACSGC